jgi:hypothetical protein
MMLRIEDLNEFTPGIEQLLFPYSAEEFLREGALASRVLEESEAAKVIYAGDTLLCYAGIVRPSFLDTPILWLMLGKNVTRWSARTFRQLTAYLQSLFPRVHTIIETRYEAGKKFAAFCGFRPMGIFVEIDGNRFEYYEVT